jgi:hypothetical protein
MPKDNKNITSILINKNMARAIRIIKNTKEYKNTTEVLLDPNFSVYFAKALAVVEANIKISNNQEVKQNGTRSSTEGQPDQTESV